MTGNNPSVQGICPSVSRFVVVMDAKKKYEMKEEMAFKPREAGEILGICRTTVYARIKDGSLRSKRLGGLHLIPRSELDRILLIEQ